MGKLQDATSSTSNRIELDTENFKKMKGEVEVDLEKVDLDFLLKDDELIGLITEIILTGGSDDADRI